MKKLIFIFLIIFFNLKAQDFENGKLEDLPLGIGWFNWQFPPGCFTQPGDINTSDNFGGPSGAGVWANITPDTGLFQIIDGFIPGNSYTLTFLIQRNLLCAFPNPNNIIIDISYTYTTYSYNATQTFWLPQMVAHTFIALNTKLCFAFSAGSLNTNFPCGVLLTDFKIVPTPLNLNFNNFNNNLLINESIIQNNFECKIIEEKYYDLLGNELFIKPKKQYFILRIVKKCGQEIILINKKIIIYD